MSKDPAIRAFVIHLAAYLAVTLVCAGINLWLAPDNLWFIWVALGWGIGVAAHGLALVLRNTRRRERIFIDPKARRFTIHLFVFVAIIALLFAVNFTASHENWWFLWVALGWGAGVAFHAWCAFGKNRSGGQEKTPARARGEGPLRRRRKAAPKS